MLVKWLRRFNLHFGSSRNQASLHTGVVYLSNRPKPSCFSSVSSCLSHEPSAIWAHLKPLLSFLKHNFPVLNTVHFFSDEHSTQYRQKNNFYLFSHITCDIGFKMQHGLFLRLPMEKVLLMESVGLLKGWPIMLSLMGMTLKMQRACFMSSQTTVVLRCFS